MPITSLNLSLDSWRFWTRRDCSTHCISFFFLFPKVKKDLADKPSPKRPSRRSGRGLWKPSWWQILPRASGGTSAENEKCLRITAAMLRKSKNTKCPNYNFFLLGLSGVRRKQTLYFTSNVTSETVISPACFQAFFYCRKCSTIYACTITLNQLSRQLIFAHTHLCPSSLAHL